MHPPAATIARARSVSQTTGLVGEVRQALGRELDRVQDVEIDVQPPLSGVRGQRSPSALPGADRIVGDLGQRRQPHPAIGEGADVELVAPRLVAGSDHDQLLGAQRR